MSSLPPNIWDVSIEGSVGSFRYQFEFTSHDRCLSLIGNNGAGKSTLIRCLAGLEIPKTGHIRFLDRTLFDSSKGFILPPQQRWCGYIPQAHALLPHINVLENIVFALRARGQNESLTATARAHLQAFGLTGLANRLPPTLSGGEYQRVALIRTLVQTNAYLLLDEPLSSLDVENRSQLRHLLAEYLQSEQVPAVIATHDDRDVFALSPGSLLIEYGTVTEHVTLDGLNSSSHPFLREFFRLKG